MILLLAACSGGEAEPLWSLEDWGGPAGAFYELIPLDAPDSVPLLVQVSADSWELRYGDNWRTAQDQGEAARQVGGQGYVVGSSMLLPAGLEVGSSAQGTTIEASGEREVWYGTFPDVLSVEVGEGEFSGPAAFAAGVGPILLSFGGREWELAGYELE